MEESRPGGGGLVLVIEDDRELAEEIRLDLEASSHAVQVAETLTEGLRTVRSGDAAVLVIDRVLEGENGLSIVEALRTKEIGPLSSSSANARRSTSESRD